MNDSFEGFRSLEANFTPTPNQFFDHVVPNFPGGVVAVVATIIRATLGWTDSVTGEKRVEAELSQGEIMRRSGLSRNAVKEALRKAVEAGLIVETAEAYATSGSRYALRWENDERQKIAIERYRRAMDDLPPSLPEGMSRGGQKVTPSGRGSKSDPLEGVKKCPPIKETIDTKKKQDKEFILKETLNVGGEGKSESEAAPKPTQRATVNAGASGINAIGEGAVGEVIALTGDEGSRRRFRQLWEVAERSDALAAWDAALQALQSRKTPPTRPGAYFARVCVQELEKRGVFVPTHAAKTAEGDVGAQIALSLETADLTNLPEKRLGSAQVANSAADALGAALRAVEVPSTGFSESDPGFAAFVIAERERYAAELADMSEAGRARLLAAFDRPEKRHSLLERWGKQISPSSPHPSQPPRNPNREPA